MDEARLASQAAVGDRSALEKLLAGHARAAYSLALAITGNTADAEDACQEALLRATRDVGGYRPVSSFRSWLLVIVRNSAISLVRSRHARREREAGVSIPQAQDAEAPVELRELALALQGAMASLDERFRLPVLLHYQQGLSHSEVAEVLEQPPGTVAANISRGVEQLRAVLRRAGFSAAPAAMLGALAHTAPEVPATLLASISKLALGTQLSGAGGMAALPAAVKGGVIVKIGLAFAAAGIVAGTTVWAVNGRSGEQAQPKPAPAPAPAVAAPDLGKLPEEVVDDSSADWVVEPFVGNASAGMQSFLDGPALQAGGIGGGGALALVDDGTAYLRCGAGLVRITPEGVVRLVLNSTGKVEGPAEEVAAGDPIWNPKDKSLYLTGPNCIRRLYTKPDGTRWVEVVAGTPGKPGKDDGPARTATIMSKNFSDQNSSNGICATSKGVIYFSDGGIRKLENGAVTTVTRDVPGFQAYNEEDDLFYLPAGRGEPRGPRSFDPKTGKCTVLAGVAGGHPRCNKNCDGPAMTHVSFNSNFSECVWDPFHKALWVAGPDEQRCRWLKDGWVKSVITQKQSNLNWVHVCGVDSKGRVYIRGSSNPTGIWRAYNKKEVKP